MDIYLAQNDHADHRIHNFNSKFYKKSDEICFLFLASYSLNKSFLMKLEYFSTISEIASS